MKLLMLYLINVIITEDIISVNYGIDKGVYYCTVSYFGRDSKQYTGEISECIVDRFFGLKTR